MLHNTAVFNSSFLILLIHSSPLEILTMTGQLLLGLSLLVGLHEFGHFAFAKLFKIRVDKFYIFFDFLFPMPSVANFALFKKKIGETEYGIGWFPLGGYVQIHGMIDETQDASALAGRAAARRVPGQAGLAAPAGDAGRHHHERHHGHRHFLGHDASLRRAYLPASEARFGILPNGLGREIGFRTGDKIVKINGRPFNEFDDVYKPDVIMGSNSLLHRGARRPAAGHQHARQFPGQIRQAKRRQPVCAPPRDRSPWSASSPAGPPPKAACRLATR